MKYVLLASALLLAKANAQLPAVDMDNLIPQWLPQCFDEQQGGNPFEVVECIRGNSEPSCLEKNFQETMMDVVQCVNISMFDDVTEFFENFNPEEDLPSVTSKQGGDPLSDLLAGLEEIVGIDTDALFDLATTFVNSTLECLDPYVECVNQTIHEAMNTQLEPCINQTLQELVDCGRTNGEACVQTCNDTQLESDLLLGLDFMSVQTCQGIQANVMDPLCGVVSCCEPCVAKMEALMQCIVNDQLDQVPAVGQTCNSLACPAASQRKLRPSSNRVLEKAAQPDEDCLQYSPGLTGDDGTELSARSAVFMPCVSNSFLSAVQLAATEESVAATTGDSKSAAGVRAVGSIGFVLALASVVL